MKRDDEVLGEDSKEKLSRRKNKVLIQGIVSGVVAIGLVIAIVVSLIASSKDDTEDESKILVIQEPGDTEYIGNIYESSIEDLLKVVSEDSATSASSDEESSVVASSEGSSGEISQVDSNDPGSIAAYETGEAIDLADLLSASSVGENTSITYGIDVSRFQGTIDWAKVAESGIDFAMIRVGYRDAKTGEIQADSNAKYNMQEAEKYGIKVGAYFFSTAISADEAEKEADWVVDYIDQYSITYPVGYNCEGFENSSSRQYGLTNDERSSIATSFMKKIYNAGYTPIFYASENELANDAKWNTSQIEQTYKVWLAWYNQSTSNLEKGPAYDGQCAMWQYTNQGTVPGISGAVDLDIAYFGYNGTETAKDTSERETVSADVEALMNFEEVNESVTAKSSTNLRDKPSQGSDSTVMMTLQNGQVATRTGISSSGWSRVVYEGTTYYAVSSYLTTDLTAAAQVVTQEETSGFKTKFTDCYETVTAKEVVNLRSKPSVTDEDSVVVATLYAGDTAIRTGINTDYGWSRVEYNGQVLYCVSSYLRVVE